jgi:NADH-quinone oxidoreductase subunit N
MIEILPNLKLIAPEIVVAVGSLLALLLSTFDASNMRYGLNKIKALSWWISVLTLLMATLVVQNVLCEAFSLWNGAIKIDEFTCFSKTIVLLIVLLNLLGGALCKKRPEVSVLILLSTLGMMLLISAGSLLTFYLGLELMSLPLYALAASGDSESNSAEAGLKYFILGAIASGIFLMGASFIYGFSSCIGFDCIYDYYANLNAGNESVVMPVGLLLGLILVLIAIAFKISAVPFHMWAPDVYQGSPTAITMFFASAPKAAVLLVLCKLVVGPFTSLFAQWQQILVFLAVASMLVGSFGAIMQRNIKRMLAYSSIGHVGFILCALVSGQESGVSGMIVYTIIYATMSIGMFGLLLMLKKGDNGEPIVLSDLAGLSKSSLPGAFFLLIFIMSMAGIPPFAGFFAKFYVLSAMIEGEQYALSAVFIASAVISTFYYLRVVKAAFFDAPAGHVHQYQHGLVMFIVICMAAFNLLYILYPNMLLDVTSGAIVSLFN